MKLSLMTTATIAMLGALDCARIATACKITYISKSDGEQHKHRREFTNTDAEAKETKFAVNLEERTVGLIISGIPMRVTSLNECTEECFARSLWSGKQSLKEHYKEIRNNENFNEAEFTETFEHFRETFETIRKMLDTPGSAWLWFDESETVKFRQKVDIPEKDELSVTVALAGKYRKQFHFQIKSGANNMGAIVTEVNNKSFKLKGLCSGFHLVKIGTLFTYGKTYKKICEKMISLSKQRQSNGQVLNLVFRIAPEFKPLALLGPYQIHEGGEHTRRINKAKERATVERLRSEEYRRRADFCGVEYCEYMYVLRDCHGQNEQLKRITREDELEDCFDD